MGVEDRRGNNEDGGVDEQGQHQRDGAVGGGPADGVALALVGPLEPAGLHDRGMQVEIMRHHGRAEDADGDVEHLGIGHDLAWTE